MINPKRIEINIKPNTIEKLGNNTYYYNYDIKSEIVDVLDNMSEEYIKEIHWNYIQVHLNGQPDYKECVKAIIRLYVDQDEEFDLINSSNRIILGLSDSQADKQKYLEYLTIVENIKTKVKADFNLK